MKEALEFIKEYNKYIKMSQSLTEQKEAEGKCPICKTRLFPGSRLAFSILIAGYFLGCGITLISIMCLISMR